MTDYPMLDDKLATLRHAIEGGVKADSMQAMKLMELVDAVGEQFNREVADAAAGEQRDGLTQWRTTYEKPTSISPHHSATVLAVIDDARYRLNGDDPFVDIAAYWPALDKWTITSQCRADAEVDDYPVNVAFWMPLPEAPVKRAMTLIASDGATASDKAPIREPGYDIHGDRLG